MKKVYEIINIDLKQQCAIVSSYKKAVEYVLANTDNRVSIVEIRGNQQYCGGELKDIPKTYLGETKIYGKYYGFGWFGEGFLIKQLQVL